MLSQDRELAERQVGMAEQHAEMLRRNTALTEEVARLTAEIRAHMPTQQG